ncbi:protein RhsC [Lachnospiraceae bacterium]|nr:protein RhsC [Lachnospiraceae bacterium]
MQGVGLSHVQTMDDGAYHAYHKDEQGSTAYVTGNGGGVENYYSYDAFGNVLEKKEDIQSRILYTGQQYDQETNQYYLRARYYNPLIGRFTQEDIYRGDGLNLYAYCGNNPVMYYDPSGYAGKITGTCPAPELAEYEGDKSNAEVGGADIPWSSKEVSEASKQLDEGARTVTVSNRSQAEELFLGRYQGEGYTNVTGMDAMDTKNFLGSKDNTYHWDDMFGSDGYLLGHSSSNPDASMAHLQIHPRSGNIIRIFFGETGGI